MNEPGPGFFRKTARNIGVQPDDIDDVLQEARIRQWRSPDVAFVTLVRRASIDWLRMYGRRGRRVGERIIVYEWDAPYHAPFEVVEWALDFYRAWRRLTAIQRRWIRLSVNGRLWKNSHRVRAAQSRGLLRRYMEAA